MPSAAGWPTMSVHRCEAAVPQAHLVTEYNFLSESGFLCIVTVKSLMDNANDPLRTLCSRATLSWQLSWC